MNTTTSTTTTAIEKALWLHDCCGAGKRLVDSFMLANPGVKIENITYFNVHEKGYDKQYGFTMDDLKKNSYIFYKGELIKRGNNE
jgi:hypothetical protein